MNEVLQATKGFNAIFIHSTLDDAGLSPNEFRVYAHLSRRASSGYCYPSVDTIAQVCRMHPDTARICIKVLSERRMLDVRDVPGRSNRYVLTPPAEWVIDPPETKGGVGYSPLGNEGRRPPETKGDAPPKRRETKDIQLRISIEGNPNRVELPSDLKSEKSEKAWQDWIQHRKEIRKKLTPLAAKKVINLLRQWGEDKWALSIERSITNGWQGLFEPVPTNGLSRSQKYVPNL